MVCIFIIGKNAYSVFTNFGVLCCKMLNLRGCTEAMHFSCVASVTHFLFGKEETMRDYHNNQDLMAQLKGCCTQTLKVLEICENHSDRQCLKEIQTVIKNKELDDFEVVEEIVEIMMANGWNVGTRHDFG